MTRELASQQLRELLNQHNLRDWNIRLTTNISAPLGLCSYKDKTIILNAHHIDTHPEPEIIDTIRHEVAHALTPGHQHDQIWKDKAKELGCYNLSPCATITLNQEAINAVRSGATLEVEWEEKTVKIVTTEEQKVIVPKYKIHQLKEYCKECGAVAEEWFVIRSKVDEASNKEFKFITLKCGHIITKEIPLPTPFQNLVSNWWKEEIKACKHDWNAKTNPRHNPDWQSNRCLNCGEFKLLPFQVEGARFVEVGLATGKGILIADDMGLGKTVQGLAYIRYHQELAPVLFIVKSALTFQWFKEIIRWVGPEWICQIIKTGKDPILPGLKGYIISYDLFRRIDPAKIDSIGYKLVIVDECQQIKNVDSTRTQHVRRVINKPDVKVIPMSGTPWKNRGSELFPVCNILDPIKFNSQVHFVNDWVQIEWEGTKRKERGIKRIPAFKEFTKDLIIRREFDEVMEDFPSVNRMKLNVELDQISAQTYQDEVSAFVKWYNDYVQSGEEDKIDTLELIAKMQRMRHLVGLAKIPATMAWLEDFIEDTDKSIVIFVHHRDVARLLYKQCKEQFGSECRVEAIASDTSSEDRFRICETFGIKRTIVIASTLAAGEGLDGLQKGHDAIMHERQWNPQNEDQAAPGRFKRFGQKSSSVNITFPVAVGTVDEYLDAIVETKRKSFHEVMNKGEAPKWVEDDIVKSVAARIYEKFMNDNKPKFKIGTKKPVQPMVPTMGTM